MAKAYLKFTRTGKFTYTGGCSVEVDDPVKMKEVWAAANDFIFKEYLVREREYSDEEWSFELMKIEEEIEQDIA